MEIRSILFFGIFIIAIILIFVGPVITDKFKPTLFKRELSLDYGTVPFILVLFSFIVGLLTWDNIKNGFIGSPPLQPYTIVIFFFSFAYLCVSLDQTGLFKYIALVLINKSNGDGKRLFNIIFFLSSALTIVTSNDIVILTLTPIVLNIIKETKIKGLPYLICQFFAANIWSMFLLIGNPTNIIVGVANDIDFFEYIRLMFFPTLFGGLVSYFILKLIFKKSISITFEQPPLSAESAFSDRLGAKILTPLFFISIIMISISDYIGTEMWIISLIFACIAFFVDLTRFLLAKSRDLHVDEIEGVHPEELNYPDLRIIVRRLPFKIFSFTLSFFIFVEGLQHYGFTALLANFFSNFVGNPVQNAVFMAFSSALFANLMNNQPMTVLFTETLADRFVI